MENFSSFEKPITPKKDIGSIISHAFDNYMGVVLYSIVFSILYIIASIIISSIFSFLVPGGDEYKNEIMEVINDFSEGKKFDIGALEELQQSLEGARTTSIIIFDILSKSISSALLTPLVAGVLYIAHKFNTKQALDFNDLFIGYRQNTIQLIIYGFIVSALMYTGFEIHKIIGIYISFACFLGLPIVFFENKSAVESIRKSLSIVHSNFIIFLVVFLVSIIISFTGVILCGIGLLFTFPFFYSIRYSLYSALCGTPYEVKS